MELSGRHALVCGASRGIGRAAAKALASLGADVTVLARDADRLDALVPELKELGSLRPARLVADFDDRDDLERKVGSLAADRPIQIVVHNTGGPPSGALLDATPGEITRAISRHLLTAHTLVRATLPGMKASGWGRYVQVLSTSVREPIDGLGVSNLTRAAVASWAKTLSRELPPGITINNVLPGFTDTERLAELAASISARTGQSVASITDGWKAAAPEGRLGDPREIGEVIAFLCSPRASFVRGVSLAVDGGRLRSL